MPSSGPVLATDSLTGLVDGPSLRRWAAERLASGPGSACTVLLLHLRRFERINTTYCRAVADEILRRIADRLREATSIELVGVEHQLGRTGGAEFAVVIAGTGSEAAAAALAERMARSFAQPFVLLIGEVRLACRIGIATASAGTAADGLFGDAGRALLDAAALPPNGIVAHRPDAGRTPHAATLPADLRRAIERCEIELRYQPQVRSGSGDIVGVEALARWHHPEHGPLPADMLVEVAEAAELCVELDEHVLARGVAAAASWRGRLRQLPVSINVGAASLAQEGFAPSVEAIVAAAGLPPARLTVEVTESSLITDMARVVPALERLRALGVRIALDDFGTGYSSLAYLRRLPLDMIKLDKDFIADLGSSPRDRALLRGVVAIARALGLGVVAEGVEGFEQRAVVEEEGCDAWQGFLCAPALDEGELAALLDG